MTCTRRAAAAAQVARATRSASAIVAVIGPSLPEIVILREGRRPRLIATLVGTVASGILTMGRPSGEAR